MKLWLTKISVVLITFMTFGLFIPPTYLDVEAQDEEQSFNDIAKQLNDSITVIEESEDVQQQFVAYVSEQARLQSMQKFGPKITSQVGDEFLDAILPKIEEVIEELVKSTKQSDLQSYEISERPTSGYGEKIFHIFNNQTGKDVARFHVRRVKHPRYGYSFNFHYHLQNDNFENHYHLGDIYWAKNTPPKWVN